jgi:hypothetical protein
MPEFILDVHKLKTPIDHPDSSITTAKLANACVTTAKIADANVTQAKLAAALWDALEKIANKGVANGYVELDSSALVPTSRIPNLTRSKITDFFNSPFWNNIPDKPSSFTPSAHASSHAPGGSDDISGSYVKKSGDTMSGNLAFASGKIIDFYDEVGDKIRLYSTTYGLSINSSELTLYLPSASALKIRDGPSGNVLAQLYPSSSFQKVAEVTVSSNTTSVSLTGLDINTAKMYILQFLVKNAGTACFYYLFVNNNTTQTNYYTQYFGVGGTGTNAQRANDARFNYTNASSESFVCSFIGLTPDGKYKALTIDGRQTGSSTEVDLEFASSTFTMSNITDLTIQAGSANQIAAGSKVILWGGG